MEVWRGQCKLPIVSVYVFLRRPTGVDKQRGNDKKVGSRDGTVSRGNSTQAKKLRRKFSPLDKEVSRGTMPLTREVILRSF